MRCWCVQEAYADLKREKLTTGDVRNGEWGGALSVMLRLIAAARQTALPLWIRDAVARRCLLRYMYDVVWHVSLALSLCRATC